MKFLERLALILFSIIMIILAITSCLIVFDIVQLKTIYKLFEELLKDDIAKRVIIGSSIVTTLLAIKSLFFPTKMKKKQEIKSGVLLENKDGRLLISKDTIENLVNSVVNSFEETVDSQTKVVLDSDNNLTVFVSLLVKDNSIIKEMSSNMQNKIKETIKRNTDLDVNQVNINIRDIDSKSSGKNSQTKIKINNVKVNQEKINQEKINQEKTQKEETTNNEQNQQIS